MDYQLNSNMVACNPEAEVIFSDGKRRLEISLAEHDGKWAYGYDYTYPLGGSCASPAFNEYRATFATRAEAREAVLSMWAKEIAPSNNGETGQLDLFGDAL